MNEFDDLFEERKEPQVVNNNNGVEDLYRHINHQQRNGILLMVYIGILVLFSFVGQIFVNARYGDIDTIIDNIYIVEEPTVSILPNDDTEYPYTVTLTGDFRNDTGIELPVFWIDIEFFDAQNVSYGVYTYSDVNIGIYDDINVNESLDIDFNPVSYEITYGFDEGSIYYSIMGLIPVMLSAIAFLFIDFQSFKNDWKRFKTNIGGNIGQIVSGFFMVYAALFVSQLLLTLLGVTETSQNEMTIQSLFTDDPLQIVLLFLLLCVFTPITEEIIFRKVIYNFVEPKGGHILAIIFTGAIFGLMHVISYGDFIQAIPYVMMGLTFGYIYYRSQKNILVTIGVHFINNLISFVIYVLAVYGLYYF